MKKNIILNVVIAMLILTGCQEVIQIDLEEGPVRLVVEGRIERVLGSANGYQKITLSQTDDYFSNARTPRVSDADVRVTDSNGRSYLFTESEFSSGVYEHFSFIPERGETYTLEINHNGQTYIAEETVHPVPPIDSIYQKFVEENLFDEAGIRVAIDYSDPADQENYYYWEQYRDRITIIEPNPGTKWGILSSDEYYNGNRVVGKVINDELIYESGQEALVKQISLSKQAFEYYFNLFDQAGSNTLFDVPPATLRGNIVNTTDPEDYALGYFVAGEVAEARLIIP